MDNASDSIYFGPAVREVLREEQGADLVVVTCVPDLYGIEMDAPICLHVFGTPASAEIALLGKPEGIECCGRERELLVRG